MIKCLNCGKENEYVNYCDWGCSVAHAVCRCDAVELTPNRLPISCIKENGSRLEHEHGDHPDYLFPVHAVWCGTDESNFYWGAVDEDGNSIEIPMTPEERSRECNETHALIYADGNIAVTMYEACYAMWYLHDGSFAGGSLWKRGEWQLTRESIQAILQHHETSD